MKLFWTASDSKAKCNTYSMNRGDQVNKLQSFLDKTSQEGIKLVETL